MNPVDVVKKALTDIEKGKIEDSIYADDMTFTGPVPQPLKRDEYLSLVKKLSAAIPDWDFHARNFSVSGNTVKLDVAITGAQTETLEAIMPGMEDLRPTNKCFSLPEEHLTVTVRGDKIAKFYADVPANGGIPGLLAQLGVALKKAA